MIKSKKNPVIEEIRFPSEKYSLRGFLHRPTVNRPPFIIGCHGLFSDKNSTQTNRTGPALQRP